MTSPNNTFRRAFSYSHTFATHNRTAICFATAERATARGIITERNAIYLYKAGTVGANVLQKEMRYMQWQGARQIPQEIAGNAGIYSNLAEQTSHNDRVARF